MGILPVTMGKQECRLAQYPAPVVFQLNRGKLVPAFRLGHSVVLGHYVVHNHVICGQNVQATGIPMQQMIKEGDGLLLHVLFEFGVPISEVVWVHCNLVKLVEGHPGCCKICSKSAGTWVGNHAVDLGGKLLCGNLPRSGR